MFSIQYFFEVLKSVFLKLPVTLEIAVISALFSLIIGVIIALIAYYKVKILYPITRVYVSLMRGTPIVAQLYFFYFGVAVYSSMVRSMTPLIAVTIVLSLNEGAFMSESIRGALMSVDEGQKEAAYSLGMTNLHLATRIVIPQAIRIALPPLFNDIIAIIKGSSLAFMIGVVDIMGAAKMAGAKSFRFFEIYAAVMVVYWCTITVFGILHKYIEKKCAEAY